MMILNSTKPYKIDLIFIYMHVFDLSYLLLIAKTIKNIGNIVLMIYLLLLGHGCNLFFLLLYY